MDGLSEGLCQLAGGIGHVEHEVPGSRGSRGSVESGVGELSEQCRRLLDGESEGVGHGSDSGQCRLKVREGECRGGGADGHGGDGAPRLFGRETEDAQGRPGECGGGTEIGVYGLGELEYLRGHGLDVFADESELGQLYLQRCDLGGGVRRGGTELTCLVGHVAYAILCGLHDGGELGVGRLEIDDDGACLAEGVDDGVGNEVADFCQ